MNRGRVKEGGGVGEEEEGENDTGSGTRGEREGKRREERRTA